MKDSQATGSYYTIGAISMITGLTGRTIRSYISSGLLTGEKINGLWHFSPERVEAFLADPAVYPSIRAKNNALVYDFMANGKKERHETCIILDLAGDDKKAVAEFFCYSISNGDFRNIRFSMDAVKSDPRVILSGDAQDVLALVNRYYTRNA